MKKIIKSIEPVVTAASGVDEQVIAQANLSEEKNLEQLLGDKNETITKSICERVPEHEPWLGHTNHALPQIVKPYKGKLDVPEHIDPDAPVDDFREIQDGIDQIIT